MAVNKNEIIGEAFEEMSISEMTRVQGNEDVSLEASPVVATTVATAGESAVLTGEAISAATAGASATIEVTKTVKNHCK